MLLPGSALLDLADHDVTRERGLYYILQRKGLMERVVTDESVAKAMTNPPATTRARLRGEFIKAAKARKRDFTVDWVHLKLNDQAQRTVLCRYPVPGLRRAGRQADRKSLRAKRLGLSAPSGRAAQATALPIPGRWVAASGS